MPNQCFLVPPHTVFTSLRRAAKFNEVLKPWSQSSCNIFLRTTCMIQAEYHTAILCIVVSYLHQMVIQSSVSCEYVYSMFYWAVLIRSIFDAPCYHSVIKFPSLGILYTISDVCGNLHLLVLSFQNTDTTSRSKYCTPIG